MNLNDAADAADAWWFVTAQSVRFPLFYRSQIYSLRHKHSVSSCKIQTGIMAQSVQFADFNDEKHFLTWDHIPAKGHGWRPSGHWAMLAEIIDFDNFLRYRTTVKDENDEELVVAFYLDNNAAFDFSKLKAGHTMVIMYPYQHHFLDGSYGVRIENPDHVRVGLLLATMSIVPLLTPRSRYRSFPSAWRSCSGSAPISSSILWPALTVILNAMAATSRLAILERHC